MGRGSLGWTVVRLLIFVCTTWITTAGIGLSARASVTSRRVTAHMAKTVSLVETGHLTFDPSLERGAAIGERGSAVGTYNAPVEVLLTIHAHYVTADVTIYAHGGSIAGAADANYTVTGSVGSFYGTLTIKRGTGTFRHISGKLQFKGAINHQNFKMWVVTEGKATY